MKILFWNCKHNISCEDIILLLKDENIDVAFFAEATSEWQNETLCKLNDYVAGSVIGNCKKIIYIHKTIIKSAIVREQGRYLITKITDSNTSFIIGSVHMRDKRSSKDQERIHDCTLLADDMRNAENDNGISNSIIIGDFNCNPWETPMTLKYGLNAVMYKDVIKNHNGGCVYGEVSYKYYYNPMLSFVSEDEGKLGSIYNTNDVDTIYWNIFDQVLISPTLVDRLSKVELLKGFCGVSLVSNKGIPNKEKYSDHLPLIVEVSN